MTAQFCAHLADCLQKERSMTEFDKALAEEMVAQALIGADLKLGWRDAGYSSAKEAAKALLGSDRGAAYDLAVEQLAKLLPEVTTE